MICPLQGHGNRGSGSPYAWPTVFLLAMVKSGLVLEAGEMRLHFPPLDTPAYPLISIGCGSRSGGSAQGPRMKCSWWTGAGDLNSWHHHGASVWCHHGAFWMMSSWCFLNDVIMAPLASIIMEPSGCCFGFTAAHSSAETWALPTGLNQNHMGLEPYPSACKSHSGCTGLFPALHSSAPGPQKISKEHKGKREWHQLSCSIHILRGGHSKTPTPIPAPGNMLPYMQKHLCWCDQARVLRLGRLSHTIQWARCS